MRTFWISVFAALAFAACGGGDGSNTLEFDEVPTAVEITTASGNITITGNAAVDTVSVATTVDGSATPTISLDDGVLSAGDDCAEDCSVDYSVLLAEGADVVVATTRGNITLSDVDGNVTIDATDGAVTLNAVVGDMQIAVGEGNVLGTRLESSAAAIEVGTGDIDVTFDEVIASLTAVTERGDITVQLPDGDYTFDTDPEDRTELRIDPTDGASNSVSLTTADGEIIVYRR